MADIPQPTLDLLLSSPKYQGLLQAGIPPNVAMSIMTKPSYAEGQGRGSQEPYLDYPGVNQEYRAGEAGQRDEALADMWLRSVQQSPRAQDISYQPGGGGMPPWNNMTPQQRALFIQMLMNRGIAGMQQPGMGNLSNALLAQQMGSQVPGGMGAAQGGGVAQNPALMQYLMGLGGGAASQPTLAQLLANLQQQQGGMNQWQPYGPAA